MEDNYPGNRREFLKKTGFLAAGTLLLPNLLRAGLPEMKFGNKVKISAHLWVYASAFPPKWDSTPVLENAFSDLSAAGYDGLELMEVNLLHDDAVKRISGLMKKYKLPVTGTSFGGALWDKNQNDQIIKQVETVVPRLKKLKAKTFGISVGSANRTKTEAELDAQADILKKIVSICDDNGIEANLHNHTYEVINGLHDLKGTLARLPQIKLGPDLNWLIRGGVNPVEFINTYGKQITYLHIRDQYANGDWTEYVGQGVTDFTAIAKALAAQNFKGRAAIELAFPNNFKPVNSLQTDWKLSREHVKKTFGW